METDGLYWERDNVHWPGRLSRWCAEIMVTRYAQGVKELAAEHGWLIDGIAIREVDNCVYYAVVPVGGKARKVCADCADRLREEGEVAEASEGVIQGMMGYKGRR